MDKRHRALLDAILADPRDTHARQVYGDLLQSEGDPRGELIAMQLANVAEPATKLIAKHKKAWIARFGEAKGARWEFRRGFCEKLSMDLAHLATLGKAILADEPVEELSMWKVDEAKGKLATVLALPGLRRVRRLSMARSELGSADLAAVATATTLGAVEWLDLSICQLDPTSGAVLAKAKLPALRELKLGTNDLGDAGVASLAKAKWPLERLAITRNGLGEAATRALAKAPFARTLTHLDLSQNEDLRDDALIHLVDLPALRSLRLEYCGISDASRDVLLRMTRLEHLDLSTNLLGDARDAVRAAFGDRLRM